MSKKSKTDLIVRQRFQNPLPPPSFPPKLLTIKTDPARYATYEFLVPLSMERAVPMIVDAEGGMHLDQSLVPGYWESTTQGRSGKMAPDMSIEAPEMDENDLALLVDPPSVVQTAAGIMPSLSGASLDIVGSGKMGSQAQNPANALDRRKKDVAWLKRTDLIVATQASQAAKKEALANQMANQQATQVPEQTLEQQIDAITSTFSAIESPLSSLRHPTKAHLQAVETYDVLPDERIWGNQYALFKFADHPLADTRLASTLDPTSTSSSNIALFRPLQSELDEYGANRVAYFLPDDESVRSQFSAKRRDGRDVDQDIMNDTVEAAGVEFDGDDEDTYGFRFVRDYDAIRREVRSEYVICLNDGDGNKEKGAYYVPLTGHTLLRKRRARKGEITNDYSDLGVEYWGGILVSMAGKEVLPEDEIEGRKEDIESLLPPPGTSKGASHPNGMQQKQEENEDVKKENEDVKKEDENIQAV